MNKFLLFAFCFFTSLSFSQTTTRGAAESNVAKLIYGKVSFQDSYQKNVDVINYTTKRVTQTSELGEFMIEAKINDVLVFMSDAFADQKYTVTEEDYKKGTVTIKLTENPILLKEIEITQLKAIKAEMSQTDIKTARIQKDARTPRNKEIYTGEIENGVDFVMIGKMIGKLFKNKNKEARKAEPTISFTDYAKENFDQSFFVNTLKIKPSETGRFLQYCEADPKSKDVIKTNDELEILEFLMVKKTEFEKLK